NKPTHACVDQGCETKTCDAGMVCVKGACVDACKGAMCPGGAACMNGQCGEPQPTTATGAGGSTGVFVGAGGDSGPAGGGGGAGVGPAGGGGWGAGHVNLPTERGCGCEVPGQATGRFAAASPLLLLVALASRRRRPVRASARAGRRPAR